MSLNSHRVPLIFVFALLFCLLPLSSPASAQTTKKSSSSSSSSSSSYTPPPRTEPAPHPAPSYTPAPHPAPSYTPQPRSTPQPSTNNNYHPTPSYTPQPSGNNGYRPPVNNPTQPRSYTPGGNNASTGNTYTPGRSTSGTTYTPGTAHTYTPGSNSSGSNSSGSKTYTPGGNVTHTANGATIYTPAAPSNSGTPTPTGTVHTPGARTANTYTPSTSVTGSINTHPVYSIPANSTSQSPKGSPLDTNSSASVIQQVNTSRASLTGINKRPLPTGAVTTHPSGSLTIASAGGKQFNLRPNGTIASISTAHQSASFSPSGKILSVHTPTVTVLHGPHNIHTITQYRPDHSTLVSTGKHSGYLQRPFTHGGQSLIARTTLSHGKTITRVYKGYSLHGAALDHYIPAHTYVADYYGWAYYAWDSPAACALAIAGQSWMPDFADYYSVPQSCSSPSDWLSSYLMGNTLQDADEMQTDGDDSSQTDADNTDPSADPDSTYAQSDSPVTPELQQAISQEVQQQIAYENAATANPSQAVTLADLPQALVPNHLFVVSSPLEVQTTDSLNCTLSPGNVIRMLNPADDSNPTSTLSVAASRKFDCPAGAQVTLSLPQLQEMENNYREQIDNGLYALHQQQGQGGLPAAPYAAIQPPPVPADEYPADHPDLAALIQSEQTLGAQTESQANQLASTQLATTVKH